MIRRGDIRPMGVAEIADRLGVSRQRAGQIVDSVASGFPRGWRLRMGHVWLSLDVEEWITAHRPHLNDPDAP